MSVTQRAAQSIRWGEIKQFSIKMLILFALITTTLMYSFIKMQNLAKNTLHRAQMQIEQSGLLSTRTIVQKLERELERAASQTHEIPPEKKQKLLGDIRTVVERWRPFVAEASAIFAPNNPPPAQPAAPRAQ